jgi:flagellar hook assembly protein FlgD
VNSQGHTTWHGPIGVDLRTAGESRFSVLPKSGGNVEVSYTVDSPQDASIEVYDISGRVIATLFNGRRERGRYAHIWNGVSRNGMRVRSGVYFCRLRTAVETKTVKFVYMR